jgi:hypothetical protein
MQVSRPFQISPPRSPSTSKNCELWWPKERRLKAKRETVGYGGRSSRRYDDHRLRTFQLRMGERALGISVAYD